MSTKELSANELADVLEQGSKGDRYTGRNMLDAATTLRTIPALEAEIEVLKAKLKKIEDLKSGAYKDLLSDINSRTYIRGL